MVDPSPKEAIPDIEVTEETEEETSSVQPEEEKAPPDPVVTLSAIQMHPNDILKALKAFVQEFQEPRWGWRQRTRLADGLGCRGLGCV